MSLKRSEWPTGVLEYMADSTIEKAIALRNKSGVPVVPSSLFAAHVRFKNGTSRHDVGEDGTVRKADATDLFVVHNRNAAKLWCHALSSGFTGIGIYFDTHNDKGEPCVMFHFDERPDPLMWVCPSRDRETEKRTYIYYRDENPAVFLEVLAAEFEKLKVTL